MTRTLIFCLLLGFALLGVPADAGADFHNPEGLERYHSDIAGSSGGGGGSKTFSGMIGFFIGIINSLVWLLGILAVLLFMWSGLQYVYKPAQKGNRSRTNMLWSLVALFVLFSLWGILRFLTNTFLSI